MSEMEQDSMKRREGRTELWLLLLIWLLRCTCNRTILCFPFDERRKWFTCNCYFPTDLLIAPTLGGWPDQLLMASSPSQSLGTAAIRLRAVSLGRECKLKWHAGKQRQTRTVQPDLPCDPWSPCKLQSPAHSHEAGVPGLGGVMALQLQKSPVPHHSQASRPAGSWQSENTAWRSGEIQHLCFWNSVSRCWTSKFLTSGYYSWVSLRKMGGTMATSDFLTMEREHFKHRHTVLLGPVQSFFKY